VTIALPGAGHDEAEPRGGDHLDEPGALAGSVGFDPGVEVLPV